MKNIKYNLIKVLIVEDDPTARRMLSHFLKQIGCVFECAANGKEAVELLRYYHFDICFLDLFMPNMGGVEATKIIRDEIDPDMPIIALTSSAMQVDKDKCIVVGMQDYIEKPADLETIVKMINVYGLRSKT